MNLQTLLDTVPKPTFIEEHFYRFPFAMKGTARPFCQLGTWELLGRILEQEDADVLVVGGGQRYQGPAPQDLTEAKSLNEQGYTILVRHAERNAAELTKLAQAFAEDFHAEIDVHIYATPPGAHGFSWHYDGEDVFIIQTAGKKDYSLRKNTVNPWPLVETIPQNMAFESEIMPLMRVELRAGDWLYVPCGYWHKADAQDSEETAISLAVGVMPPTAIDVYDFLRERLLESLLWRQRLPISGAASPMDEQQLKARYREIFSQLAADVSRSLQEERFVAEFLDHLRGAERRRNAGRTDPPG